MNTAQPEKINIKQTQPKSVLDMTPYELSQIDAWQDKNRGFEDEDEYSDFENNFDWDD